MIRNSQGVIKVAEDKKFKSELFSIQEKVRTYTDNMS